MNARRSAHLLVALLAILGIAIEYGRMASHYPLAELGWRTANFLSFFTILTNGLIAIVGIGVALPRGALHDWADRPATRTAATLYILVVAAIFQILLAGLVTLTPLGWWGNMLVHELVPALWLLCWLAFGPHGGIGGRAPLWWLIYPALYGAWTIGRGALIDWYPYPFMNVAKFGGSAVTRNMVLVGLFFLLLGYALRWIDGRLSKEPAPA